MARFIIEKNIPIPSAAGRGPRTDYPFLEMDIGDSFFVPNVSVKKMSGQVSYWKKAPHNLNLSIRAATEEWIDDEGEVQPATEGVRVWLRDPSERSNAGRRAAVTEEAQVEETPADEAPVKSKGKKSKKAKAEEAAPAPVAETAETEY